MITKVYFTHTLKKQKIFINTFNSAFKVYNGFLYKINLKKIIYLINHNKFLINFFKKKKYYLANLNFFFSKNFFNFNFTKASKNQLNSLKIKLTFTNKFQTAKKKKFISKKYKILNLFNFYKKQSIKKKKIYLFFFMSNFFLFFKRNIRLNLYTKYYLNFSEFRKIAKKKKVVTRTVFLNMTLLSKLVKKKF